MTRMYIPKVFTQYPLGYTVTRERPTYKYIELELAVVPISEDPYPLRHGTKLVQFKWQGTFDAPQDGWDSTNVQIYSNTHNAPSTVLDMGSKIGQYLISKFGWAMYDDLESFQEHWQSGSGDGDLYYLKPRVLSDIAFPMLGIPRVIFDPRVNEYVKATEIAPPWEDGWMDNNREYGPEPGRHYQTIATQVTAIGEKDARYKLFRYMAEHKEFDKRIVRWKEAGSPVIAMTQRRLDSSYYVPDPLNDHCVTLVNPWMTYPNAGRGILLFEDDFRGGITQGRRKVV